MITKTYINLNPKNNANFIQLRTDSALTNRQMASFTSKFTLGKNGLEVNVATKNDTYEIAKINAGEFEEEIDVEAFGDYFKECIENGALIHVIKDEQGQIVGSVSLSPLGEIDIDPSKYQKPITSDISEKVGLISNMYLKPKLRGQHNGTELMRHIIEDAKAKGYKKLLLFTENPIAQRIYENLGFKEMQKDNLKGFKKGLCFPEDATWMELNLR